MLKHQPDVLSMDIVDDIILQTMLTFNVRTASSIVEEVILKKVKADSKVDENAH